MGGLLRDKLGFNGLMVTDSTLMAGFTNAMPRRKAVPYAIEAGADMFLFTRVVSEDFEFNTLGAEGYMGQLMQIVYTASNFSTVKSVQFLVEGEKKDYLGSGGQWIGSPLSKNSFAY